tara:strand:- start:8752 stop:9312 length:561 start_codon:yes stop_codon:yes gene_type:complete
MKQFIKKKKCKFCNELFLPYNTTQKVCNYTCAIQYNNSKIKNEAKKKARAEKRKFYAENMTLTDWKKKVQTVFNKFIRLRDLEKGCISCGTPLQNRKFDAGHFYATTYEGIRFHEDNVHGQCVPCNRNKHGNIHEYRKRITERITQNQLDWLDQNRYLKLKLSKTELKQLEIIYKQKIKDKDHERF